MEILFLARKHNKILEDMEYKKKNGKTMKLTDSMNAIRAPDDNRNPENLQRKYFYKMQILRRFYFGEVISEIDFFAS